MLATLLVGHGMKALGVDVIMLMATTRGKQSISMSAGNNGEKLAASMLRTWHQSSI